MNSMCRSLLDKKFKALADKNRRKILQYLKSGRKCAGDIAKQFPISAPSVSYHLAILKESQLISAVHSKGFVYYDFNLDEMDEVIEWLYKISERSGENER